MNRWILFLAPLTVLSAAAPAVHACEAMLESEEYLHALARIEQRGWPVTEIRCPRDTELSTDLFKGQITMQCVDAEGGLQGPGRSAWINYDGRILVTDYRYNNSFLDGRYTTHFLESGQLVDDGHYVGGEPDGWWRSYDWENGELRGETQYRAGKLNGVSRRYDQGEILVEETHYVDGTLEGRMRRWYEDGTPMFEGSYEAGVLQGPARTWHPTGQLATDGTYVDAQFEGAYTEWYEDGTRKRQGTYLHGVEIGLWTAWNSDGTWTTQEYPTAAERASMEAEALIEYPTSHEVIDLEDVVIDGEVADDYEAAEVLIDSDDVQATIEEIGW